MENTRDDFSAKTKELLANRVGMKCSNPGCRKLTCCANTNPDKVTNIGVAAHICAAAKGGPRYDASMTPEERKSPENGIWLCQSCSKLIDTDTSRYPKELLQSWKQLAEQTAILEVETASPAPQTVSGAAPKGMEEFGTVSQQPDKTKTKKSVPRRFMFPRLIFFIVTYFIL